MENFFIEQLESLSTPKSLNTNPNTLNANSNLETSINLRALGRVRVETIASYLADYRKWLLWFHEGLISGIETEEEVGQILAKTFKLSFDTIAIETKKILRYDSVQLAKCLKGADVSIEESMDLLLNTLHCSQEEVVSAMKPVFGQYHNDALPYIQASDKSGHMDTPPIHMDIPATGGVPHTDATAIPHTDIPAPKKK